MAAILVAGDTVVVELDGHLAAAGRYVSSDASEIVLRVGGAEQRVGRREVARVTKLSRPYRRGVLIGGLIGAGIAAALFASGDDLNAAGRAMWVSIGAASGAAVGLSADRTGSARLCSRGDVLPVRAQTACSSAALPNTCPTLQLQFAISWRTR
jgi:hypothetical protein